MQAKESKRTKQRCLDKTLLSSAAVLSQIINKTVM